MLLLLLNVTAMPTLAKTKILMWDWAYAEREALFKQWAEEFSQLNPHIEVEYQSFPQGQLDEKYITSVATGTGPDFGNMHSRWRYAGVAGGLLEPYSGPYFPNDWLEANLYRFEDWFKQDGRYYTIPSGVMGAVLYRNTDMFVEAGLDDDGIPKTWAELVEVAKKLTRYDSQGQMTREGFNFREYVNFLWTDLMLQQGGSIVKEDGKTSNLYSEPGLAALEYLYNLVYTHGVSNPRFPAYSETFGTQKAAMIYSWTWMSGFLDSSFPDVNYRVSPLPTFGVTDVLGQVNPEEGLVVFKTTSKEKKEAAWEFISFIMNDDDKLIQLARLYSIVPMKTDLIDDSRLSDIEAIHILGQTVPKYVYLGDYPYEIIEILRRMEESVFLAGTDYRQALQTADMEWQEILDEKDFWFTAEGRGIR